MSYLVFISLFSVANLLKYIDNMAGSVSKSSRLLRTQDSVQTIREKHLSGDKCERLRRKSSIGLRKIIRRTCSIHADQEAMSGESTSLFI